MLTVSISSAATVKPSAEYSKITLSPKHRLFALQSIVCCVPTYHISSPTGELMSITGNGTIENTPSVTSLISGLELADILTKALSIEVFGTVQLYVSSPAGIGLCVISTQFSPPSGEYLSITRPPGTLPWVSQMIEWGLPRSHISPPLGDVSFNASMLNEASHESITTGKSTDVILT